jgi:hypothetical protein
MKTVILSVVIFAVSLMMAAPVMAQVYKPVTSPNSFVVDWKGIANVQAQRQQNAIAARDSQNQFELGQAHIAMDAFNAKEQREAAERTHRLLSEQTKRIQEARIKLQEEREMLQAEQELRQEELAKQRAEQERVRQEQAELQAQQAKQQAAQELLQQQQARLKAFQEKMQAERAEHQEEAESDSE